MVFPYRPRKGQIEMVETLNRSVSEHRHCAVQSGTGTGKTICALTAAIESCGEDGKRILYLTRTNSQQKQVIHELRAISRERPVFGVAIQGRRHMCSYLGIDEELSSGTHDELSRFCAQRKSKVLNGEPSACKFYHSLISADCTKIVDWARKKLPTAEEFVEFCSDMGVCPYEMNKIMVASARVVTAPYIYFFNPFIRNSLLDWMGCGIEDIVLIVDEAHNLPEYARELKSASLSRAALRLAEREAKELRDPEVSDGTSALDFLKMLDEVLEEAAKEFVIDEDGLIPQDLLESELMERLRLTTRGIMKLAGEIVNLGEIVRDRRKKDGHLPRSFLHSVGSFMEIWMSVSESEHVKLIIGGENPAFEAYCLDPSLACMCVHEASSSIHMSGTLDPMEEYRDSIGLPGDSSLLTFPSPFPRENLKILHVHDVTSRYEDFARDKKNLSRMRDYITGIAEEFEKNIAVFFPSYNLLNAFVKDDLLKSLSKPSFIEERGLSQDELMDIVKSFKSCDQGALLLAVAGGRISEGIDFPERELEIAIVVGIPYPKPSARTRALQHYYEVKFGKGWEYVVKAPATRKLLQSIGRLIRSESDRGAALILDKRAIHFSGNIPSTMSIDPKSEMRGFFDKTHTGKKLRLHKRKQPRARPSIATIAQDRGV